MANPTWFDYNFYMAAKLTQMQKTNPSYTPEQLNEAFKINGFDGVEGAYNHYIKHGDSEGLSPSMYMDHDVYMTAKLLQMQKTNPKYDMPQLIKDFGGLTAGEHYAFYGKKEGLNPSNAFDVDKYMADKLEQLIKTDPDGKWTPTTVQEAFDKAGLTALDHFLLYGKIEGLTAKAVDAPIHPHNPGTTTNLTDEVETFIGTAKDDVVNGAYVDLKSDKLVDAYTNDYDTINLTATGNVDANGATVTGFEALNVDYSGVFESKVDVTNFTGLQDLTVKATNASYTGGLTVAGAGTANVIAGAGVKGALVVEGVKTSIITANNDITSVKVAADTTAGMTATVKAGAKTATVDLDGTAKKADTATVVLQDNATVTVTDMTDTNDSLTLNVAADKTVTLEGDANTVAVKGAGNVTVKGVASTFDDNTVTKGNAGTLTVEVTDAIGAATDFSAVAADNIVLGAGATALAVGAVFKSGQNVEVKGDLISGATLATDATANGSLNLTMKANVAALAAVDTTLNNMNIIADVAAVGTAAKGDLRIGALTVDNALLTGTNDVTVTTALVKQFDAKGLDGKLTLTTIGDSTVKDVTVLGAKGDNTVTFADAVTKINYTGSDGVDTVTVGSAGTTGTATVNLGAGKDIANLTLTASYAGETNIFAGIGDDVVNLTATSLNGGRLFVDMGEGGNDTLHIAGATNLSAGSAVIKGVENIDLGNVKLTLNATEFAELNTVALKSGGSTGELIVTNATNAGNVTIDASGLKGTPNVVFDGKVTLTGGTGDDTITGSLFGNTITGGTGADVMTGGTGVDTFKYAAETDSAASIAANTARTFDLIKDFTAGSDKIDLAAVNTGLAGTAASGITVTTLTTATGSLGDTTIATFAELKSAVDAKGLTASATGNTGTSTGLQAYIIDLAGNTGDLGTGTYLVINNNDVVLTASDVMIQLVGTSGAITNADFVLTV